jgi:dienelactone hydrolase
MSYDPFVRGSKPVGVQTMTWSAQGGGRALPVEIYYPADERHRGEDLRTDRQDRWNASASMAGDSVVRRHAAVRDAARASDTGPLIIFSHGYSGDRREFSALCTHLASHGYCVASADHLGSTYADIARAMQSPTFNRSAAMRQLALDRLGDIPLMIDRAERELRISCTAVGVAGASFGGWTSLMAPAIDARVRAIVPMCPGGGAGPVSRTSSAALREQLTFEWRSSAAVMMLVADRDTWLPLYGQIALFARCPTPDKRLVVLQRADHQHFVDDMEVGHRWYREFTASLAKTDAGDPTMWRALADLIRPWDELMPEQEALTILCGLATLHFDACLKADARATALLAALPAELKRRGLHAFVVDVQ